MLNQGHFLLTHAKIMTFLALCIFADLHRAEASEDIEEVPTSQAQNVPLPLPTEMFDNLGLFSGLPKEIIGQIVSDCNSKIARANKALFTITTGFRGEDLKATGFGTLPSYQAYLCLSNSVLVYRNLELLIEKIPSYIWYAIVEEVREIPKSYWQYLKGSRVHTVNLNRNTIEAARAIALAQHLHYTKVHTVDLSANNIGDDGARDFAQYLQGTNVHTVSLSANNIGNDGARDFAKNLQSTNVHTVDLSDNSIRVDGVRALVQHLKGTRVHTVDLSNNNIGDDGIRALAQYLQGTDMHIVNLNRNNIGDDGTRDFAQYLQGTNLHTVDLRYNYIIADTQAFIKTQYPHINWRF